MRVGRIAQRHALTLSRAVYCNGRGHACAGMQPELGRAFHENFCLPLITIFKNEHVQWVNNLWHETG
jgi:hypothetical protein